MATFVNIGELSGTFLANSSSKNSSEMIEAGDFRIDLAGRHVSIHGQELRLTSEEFDLLVFLVGHPTSIITPQTRLSTRWGSRIARAEILRVLAQLRQKLEALGWSRCIRTEPWVVYRFDPHERH
jgi:DNA-binding response OmpR family regulator